MNMTNVCGQRGGYATLSPVFTLPEGPNPLPALQSCT